jgi:hypothetical protein
VLEGLPEDIEGMFRGQVFCGPACARAEFLEEFETLDGMLDTPAESMVVGLRSTFAQLAQTFAKLAHE